MKKIYESPIMHVVILQSGRILIGASDTEFNSSNSSDYDYVKENYPPINDKNVWDDEW